MSRRARIAALLFPFLLILIASLAIVAQRGPAPPEWPGPRGEGVTLLPNGWRIAPVGRHLGVGDLPLNMTLAPDGRHLVVTNNGWSEPTLTIVDLERRYVRKLVQVDHAWLGLAWHPDGTRLFSSGGGQNTVNELAWKDGELQPNGQIVLGAPEKLVDEDLQNAGFVGGLAVAPDGQRLFAVQVLGKSLVVVDLPRRRVIRVVDLPAEPYTCVLAPDGKALYVSVWGAARILRFDTTTLEQTGDFAVGEHPNAMAFSKDSARLFVACANTNAVWVIDLAAGTARERISVALYPNAPAGSTPNALAVSPDGGTLLVANADNNTVAVVDIMTPGKSDVEGFIPTGWYPTGVAFDGRGKRIFVLTGKGLTSEANPRGPQPEAPAREGRYVGGMMQGTLSTFDVPDDATLAAWTKRVYALTPYTDARRLAPPEAPKATPIPRRVGGPSPIRYVFYMIRENRTYDQVLGDMERGNGDPTLTLFGEEITPNAHAIARQFVVFDNFYVDAEVSFDGHAYSTAAYATDVVEKIWPTNYGGRGGVYLSEGGWGDRNPYGNLSAPPDGYIWDFAKRAGVRVRSYGEFARLDETGMAIATVPGLKGLVHPQYPPWDMKVPDGKRADVWLEEFRKFEQSGEPPRLSIIRLGNDHTAGTRPGWPTPRAMVAENDVALGRIVEAVSHSRFWKESAIFVLEDDAQNGPDHVDAHRSVLLVASPFARRGALDSTLYTTSAVLRTMELILGLPPMSQYDAAATPMYNAFQPTPVLTPFKALPARVRTDEQNPPDAPGAQASMRMNMAEADLTPELELNEIIWQSIHGRGAVMPPPIRSGFIRPVADDED